ncbi:MAG: glycosyltransferase [Bacteroidetes bacterium]|nr:glycosyltransferase [Bacteroidota bacterium]
MLQPRISIVTPSFNMLSSLPLCCESVKDQEVIHEHIIMDGGSTDGTVEWLREQSVSWVSERDKGMYNALNKALNLAKGEIIGHLNCDEQYLPGVLQFVTKFFDENPDIDFIAGNFLVIDPTGNLVAYRKSFQPRWPYFFSNYLYTTTCTLFYRRKVFEHVRFDESYKSIADVIFLYHVIRKKFKGAHVSKYMAVFTYSGKNLSLSPISALEKKRFSKTLPAWYRLVRPFFFFLFFIEKILHRNYSEETELSYSIYTNESPKKRVTKTKRNPHFRLKFKAA